MCVLTCIAGFRPLRGDTTQRGVWALRGPYTSEMVARMQKPKTSLGVQWDTLEVDLGRNGLSIGTWRPQISWSTLHRWGN